MHEDRDAFRRAMRALRVTKTCNQILVHAENESDLLRDICGVLVGEGGYQLAWVGMAESDAARSVRPVAYSGFEDGYLQNAGITWADTERGRGPVGTAIRSGRTTVCRHVITDPNFSPWREEAVKRGYGSAISLPLRSKGAVFGALNVYAAEDDAFDAEEEGLLSEMADDLAFGITTIRARIEARGMAEALRQEQQVLSSVLDAMPDHIYFKDRESRFLRVNPAMAFRHGRTDPKEMVGLTDFDLFGGEHAQQAFAEERRIILTGEPMIGVEEKETWPDGRVTYVSTTKVPLRDRDGRITGIVGISREITARKQSEVSLRLFRTLIERSNDAIEVVDPETGRYIDVNESAYRDLGYSRSEMLGLTVYDVERSLDRRSIGQVMTDLRNSGSRTLEGLHRRKDGSVYPVEVSVSLVTLDRSYIVAVVRNIAERKRTDEVLRLQSAAVNAAANAIIITDRAGVIQSANQAFADMTGYTLAETIGRNPRDLIKSEHHDQAFYRRLWETVLAGNIWDGEIVNRRKDGSTFTEAMTITPVRNARGEVAHFIAIKQDITERKAALERMRHQAALLDVATDAILVHDLSGRVRYWNRAAGALYGWTEGEAMGRQLSELGLLDAAMLRTALDTAMSQGAWSGEMRHHTKDRREITVLSRWVLVRDEKDQPDAVFVIGTDITDRKELEAQFLRAQRLESVGQLAGGIAHDLNNILSPIVMAAPLIRMEVKNPDVVRLIDIMEGNARRGAEVVKQILTFARGQQGGRAPVPTRPVMKEIVHIIDETFPKSIVLKTAIPEDLWMVEGDATQLHQVLMNLCVNARDAMSGGGTLLLAGENVTVEPTFAAKFPGAKPGPHIVWLVADTGVGISQENLSRIFEPFFTTKGSGKGTGLGLSTVHALTRQHGGFVRVESQLGEGTQFRVYLPAVPALTAIPEEPAVEEAPRGRGETILVVDDEESVRVMTRHVLEQHGYGVLLAGEGSEAVITFAQHAGEIGAVLTDLMMPLMDGAALIAALDRMSPGVKILATTGVTDTTQAAAAVQLGAREVLRKPFPPAVLLRKIRELLDEPAVGDPG